MQSTAWLAPFNATLVLPHALQGPSIASSEPGWALTSSPGAVLLPPPCVPRWGCCACKRGKAGEGFQGGSL